MSVTPLDPCENVPTTIAELGQMLCWISGNLSTLQGLSGTYFDLIANSVGANTGGSASCTARITLIINRLGDPGGGTNIDAKINTIITNVGDADADLAELADAIGFRTGDQVDLLAATQNVVDGFTVYHQARRAANNTESSGHTLGDLVGAFLAAKFGGGSDLISIGKWIQGIWDTPPVDVLTESGYTTLSPTTTITIPAGVYGYHLEFTVPGYWGQLSADPVVYQPHVAVAAWRGAWGTVGPVVLLATPSSQAYPKPAGALYLDITMRPGITGRYHELRFLGL